MYEVKYALLFILVVLLTETLQNFQIFVTLDLRGGVGVKKETKGIKFLTDINILTSSPEQL